MGYDRHTDHLNFTTLIKSHIPRVTRYTMPTSKVTRNYQITIPQEIRASAEIEEGDTLTLEYDEEENLILIKLPRRGRRSTLRLGRSLTVEEIESSIERGVRE